MGAATGNAGSEIDTSGDSIPARWRGAQPVSRNVRGQQCGIVLGGMGTGGFEVWDDGGFHLWQIFNNGTFIAGRHRTPQPPALPASGLFFALRTRTGEGVKLWKLQMPDYRAAQWIEEPYHVPELRFPDAIDFCGRQPFARLEYDLAHCPLDVTLEAFSPLVVHDLDASAWPAAVVTVRLHNRGGESVSAAVVGSLQNIHARDARDAGHEIAKTPQGIALHYPPPPDQRDADSGSMALSVFGPPPELSYCRIWPATDTNPSLFWQQLERDNRLGDDDSKIAHKMKLAAAAAAAGWKGPDGIAADLSEPDRDALARQLSACSESRAIETWLAAYKHGELSSRAGYARELLLETVLRRLYVHAPLFGSVARTVNVPPAATTDVRFLLTWHFPFHKATAPRAKAQSDCGVDCRCPATDESDNHAGEIGHRYAAFGDDALDIARRFTPRLDRYESAAAAFVEALYDSSLPPWLCDAINAQLTSLATNSWHAKNGDFALWPGSGCCGFAELGTGFFATIPLILFFPEAAKRQLELLARHQTEDGRIPHSLARHFNDPTPIYYDDDFLKFPLQVYRDWIWTGDEAYLRRMWPRLLRNLDAICALDLDGDGIPDMRGHNQDYDQWMMFGLGIYAASHWPIALRMMAHMGRAVGEPHRSEQWEAEAQRTAAHIDAALWGDGAYRLYDDRRLDIRSDALLANNLCGEWYARLTGLSPSLPADHIRRNLQAVFQRNRVPGVGLKNGWLPQSERRPIGVRDWHWNVCWLGVEYAVASHMIYEDMIDEGLTVCREAHQRHHDQSLRYNHFECGEHYTRALTIWSVLPALQDLRWDAAAGALRLRPKLTPHDHRSPLVLPSGWGVVTQSIGSEGAAWRLRIHEGSVTLRRLELSEVPNIVQLDGTSLTFQADATAIDLQQAVTVQAGSVIEARWTPRRRTSPPQTLSDKETR